MIKINELIEMIPMSIIIKAKRLDEVLSGNDYKQRK